MTLRQANIQLDHYELKGYSDELAMTSDYVLAWLDRQNHNKITIISILYFLILKETIGIFDLQLFSETSICEYDYYILPNT